MRNIKNFVAHLIKKKIITNFLYLSLLQLSNIVLPFIIIPNLVANVGVDKVGLVFMAQISMSYLTILTDYGFSMTATKFIATNRYNKSRLEYVYNAVLSTKIFLTLAAFLILLLMVVLVPVFRQEKTLIFLSFTIVIGITFFPTWFFQGVQEMKYITLTNFVSKIVSTVCIFSFIDSIDDYDKVNFLLGSGNVLSCLIAFWLIHKKYNIKTKLNVRYIKLQLNEGWHIFITNLVVSVYMYSNLFILGIFANKSELGYFGIADKCISGVRQILLIFYQVIYPKACSIARISHSLLIEFYRKFYVFFLAVIFIICCAIFILAPSITYFLTKAHNSDSLRMLRIMCFIPLIVAANIPFSQSVIIYEIKRGYTNILISAAVISIACNTFLSQRYNAFGTISSIYITEIFVTLSLFLLLNTFSKKKYSLKEIFTV